jgi:hypothetical protein
MPNSWDYLPGGSLYKPPAPAKPKPVVYTPPANPTQSQGQQAKDNQKKKKKPTDAPTDEELRKAGLPGGTDVAKWWKDFNTPRPRSQNPFLPVGSVPPPAVRPEENMVATQQSGVKKPKVNIPNPYEVGQQSPGVLPNYVRQGMLQTPAQTSQAGARVVAPMAGVPQSAPPKKGVVLPPPPVYGGTQTPGVINQGMAASAAARAGLTGSATPTPPPGVGGFTRVEPSFKNPNMNLPMGNQGWQAPWKQEGYDPAELPMWNENDPNPDAINKPIFERPGDPSSAVIGYHGYYTGPNGKLYPIGAYGAGTADENAGWSIDNEGRWTNATRGVANPIGQGYGYDYGGGGRWRISFRRIRRREGKA